MGVAAQNMHFANEGAFTGETSPMIIGHSERRLYFNETDEVVNQKLHAAIKHVLTRILCIGENLEEREDGKTEEVLRRQAEKAFKGIVPETAESFIVAYTPVWATGTGKTATPESAGMAHFFIRTEIARLLGRTTADADLKPTKLSQRSSRSLRPRRRKTPTQLRYIEARLHAAENAAIPAAIIVGAVTVAFPIGLIVFVIIGHEIVERESVVTGHKVDALLRLAFLVSVYFWAAEDAVSDTSGRARLASKEAADVVCTRS